jgi:hypothetical protein
MFLIMNGFGDLNFFTERLFVGDSRSSNCDFCGVFDLCATGWLWKTAAFDHWGAEAALRHSDNQQVSYQSVDDLLPTGFPREWLSTL